MVKINPKQVDAYLSTSRFNFYLAGRRGGKTHLKKNRITKKAFTCPAGGEIFYVGPTNKSAKDLIWEPLNDRLLDLGWWFKPRVSERVIYLSEGRKIHIIGAEKIRSIRGHKVWHCFLDEVGYFTTALRDIVQAVRPALSDLKGGMDMGTTPPGKGTDVHDFYLDILGRPEWGIHMWKTIENPWIDPAEIEAAKRELDEKSFRQEYEATWESYEGIAYYNFDENLHVVKQPVLNLAEPVHMCFDFNVDPTTLIMGQRDGDMLRYKREYSFNNSSTVTTVKSFCEDYKNEAKHMLLLIRGDAAGSSRKSTTGFSDYKYVFDILNQYGFKYKFEVASSNPPIVDRVNTVNGWLKPLVGSHRVEIDPSCKNLIRDLSSQERDGRFLSDKNNLGHKADAMGYDIYFESQRSKHKQKTTLL